MQKGRGQLKVLSVNKFYYLKGGSETCYFSLNKMCRSHNIEVVPFSMKSDKNEDSEYESYFVDSIDYNDRNLFKKFSNSAKIIYSLEAKDKIRTLMEATGPDIAHLHIFQHQLSPSIIKEIKDFGIPVVNTVHDLKPVCPNYTMLSHERICEKCRKHRYFNCLLNRCVKDSIAASFISAVEMYVHLLLGSYSLIDTYITPSRFFRDKLVEYGFSSEKVQYIPNFIDCRNYADDTAPVDYFLYFGRLSAEKGIRTLLEAMKHVKRSALLIAGDGPLREEVEETIRTEKLENVRLLGYVSGRELIDLIENSKFSILPSEWYENCPMAVLESMACGKPVIGSKIGGIPELVDHEQTGLIFEPGDSGQLSEYINRLLDNPKLILQMGRAGRQKAEREYHPVSNFTKIIDVYNQLFEDCGRRLWKV